MDQHRHRDLLGIGIAGITLHPENNNPQALADLRRRKAGTVEGIHGIEHILDQPVQGRCVKLSHRLSGL